MNFCGDFVYESKFGSTLTTTLKLDKDKITYKPEETSGSTNLVSLKVFLKNYPSKEFTTNVFKVTTYQATI